mmetsp:Transcript_79962/g.177447  ORF Transcript_79962/g.177447 Transcript_79962/m.177447 type:complete len:215 (-) Transcript_79962:1297-1941(-)
MRTMDRRHRKRRRRPPPNPPGQHPRPPEVPRAPSRRWGRRKDQLVPDCAGFAAPPAHGCNRRWSGAVYPGTKRWLLESQSLASVALVAAVVVLREWHCHGAPRGRPRRPPPLHLPLPAPRPHWTRRHRPWEEWRQQPPLPTPCPRRASTSPYRRRHGHGCCPLPPQRTASSSALLTPPLRPCRPRARSCLLRCRKERPGRHGIGSAIPPLRRRC